MAGWTHNGISLHYEVRGEGTPFIFLHGLGNDYRHAYDTIDEREGIQLISLDQQGHGDSGYRWETMSFESMGDDVLALADYLGLDRFYLGGVSMGAGVTVNVAVRHPERLLGMILIRNAWLDSPMEERAQRWFAQVDRYIGLENGKERYLQDPEVRQFFREFPDGAKGFLNYFDSEACVRMHRKFAIMPGEQPVESGKQLQSLHVPALVVACRNDLIHPYEYGEWYAAQIPGAQFVEIPAKAVDPAGYHEQLNDCVGSFAKALN